jgi:hypothetical protein
VGSISSPLAEEKDRYPAQKPVMGERDVRMVRLSPEGFTPTVPTARNRSSPWAGGVLPTNAPSLESDAAEQGNMAQADAVVGSSSAGRRYSSGT